MDYDRLLYLFREFLFILEEKLPESTISAVLEGYCGMTEDEFKYLKGEVNAD